MSSDMENPGLLFVHLSDIHFGAEGRHLEGPNAAVRDRTLDDLQAGKRELGSPDAVLVTGDIAFSAKDDQYELALEFLNAVTDAVGIEPARVLVVPGNHDVDRSLVCYSIENVHNELKMLVQQGRTTDADVAFRDYLVKDATEPLFVPMGEYQTFAARFDCHLSGKKPYWDKTFPLGEASSLLVRGLTTALVSDGSDTRANLLVGTGQTHIKKARNEVAMIMGHHPTDWWGDADVSVPQMRDVVSLALFGHKHTPNVSLGDNCLTVTAGAMNPERDGNWIPEYNWIGLSLTDEFGPEPNLRVAMWPRKFDPQRNRYRNGGDAGGWSPEPHEVKLVMFEAADKVAPGQDAAEVGRSAQAAFKSGPDAQPQADSVHDLPAEVVDQATRLPLETEGGSLEPSHNVRYAFLRLGYVERQRLLVEFELLEDGDDELDPHDLQVAAIERAAARSILTDLLAAVNKIATEDERT